MPSDNKLSSEYMEIITHTLNTIKESFEKFNEAQEREKIDFLAQLSDGISYYILCESKKQNDPKLYEAYKSRVNSLPIAHQGEFNLLEKLLLKESLEKKL